MLPIEPTRAHNPKGISIGSAVFAGLTAGCRRACPGAPSPKTLLFRIGVSGPHLLHGSLSPPEPITQTASRSIQPFLHSSRQCRRRCRGVLFPAKLHLPIGDLNPHLTGGSLAPPDSASQTASRSGQPFMQSSQQTVPILYSESLPSKKIHCHGGSGHHI